MPILKFLKNNRDIEIFLALIALALFEAGTIYHQHVQLKEAKLAYENPQVKIATREVKVEGPVRIVYRKITTPGEPVIVERIVERAPVTTTTETAKETTPIPVAVVLASPRIDRWLVGAMLDKFDPKSGENWSVTAGYGFRNRVDLMVGAHVHGHLDPFAQVVLRF